MNLASIDLNLLVAFDALMHERHVTRAGQRIGLAQPSMSSALTRLRALMDDPLFVRTAGKMTPTARALALARPVREALEQIQHALEHDRRFDPATAEHCFTIAATDYGNLVVLPSLMRALRRQAPGIDITVRPTLDRTEMLRLLERGEIDLLIGGHLPDSARILRRRLFMEHFVCIQDAARVRQGEELCRNAYLRHSHVLFSFDGRENASSVMDEVLTQHGVRRRVALILPHVAAVPFTVADTDLLATMSERIARRLAAAAGVAIRPVPFDVPPYPVDVVYARSKQGDPALSWLVQFIVDEAASL